MEGATHRVQFRSDGEHRALVLVPAASGARHPVLTFLHGRGEASISPGNLREPWAGSMARLCRHGPPAIATSAAADFASPAERAARQALADFLIVCPQLPVSRQWQASDAGWILALEEAASNDLGGDPQRAHLTGFSWGGAGVTKLSLLPALAGRWCSLWIVDPSPDPDVTPPPSPGLPAMLHFGTYFDQSKMAAWRSSSGFDGTFAVGAHRAEKNLAIGHVESARAAYLDEEAYHWLRAAETGQVPMTG